MEPKYSVVKTANTEEVLKDGHTMFADDIVEDLKALQRRLEQLSTPKHEEGEIKWKDVYDWAIKNHGPELSHGEYALIKGAFEFIRLRSIN